MGKHLNAYRLTTGAEDRLLDDGSMDSRHLIHI